MIVATKIMLHKGLFHNNFALSRDMTGLFQSFQSSFSVLDPTSNLSLFQSTLVVIIKVSKRVRPPGETRQ